MMKNEYAKASAEVVLFEAEEMVATACGDATNAYDDWVIKQLYEHGHELMKGDYMTNKTVYEKPPLRWCCSTTPIWLVPAVLVVLMLTKTTMDAIMV